MSNNLIQLLNTIYGDNNRQIQLLNTQIDNLRNQIIVYNLTNNDIHNILTTLNQPQTTNSNVNVSNTYRRNQNTHRNENSTPLFYGNTPYSENQLNNLANFLEPILIFPTTTQIEIATRTTRFSNIISPLNTSCPISLEPFNENDEVTIIRYCSHIFTTVNIQNWFRSNCKCPVCRYDIRNYTHSNPTNPSFPVNPPIITNPPNQSIPSTIPNIEPNSYTSELDTLTRNLVNSLGIPMTNELVNYNLNSYVDVSNNTYNSFVDVSNNIYDTDIFYFTYETRR